MTDIMEARRKGFEVTAREHYFLHELDHSWSEREQEYHDSDMQVAWEIYNAALDSVCVELPPTMECDDHWTGDITVYDAAELRSAIERASLKVKL